MAVATVTDTEYGYSITGGVTATTINSGKMWVKALAFAGDDATDTAVLTTIEPGAGAVTSCYKFKATTDDDASYQYAYFGEEGVPMTGLAVTLNDTGNYLYVYLA